MKHSDVVARILNYHPTIDSYDGCDDYKYGDPEAICTGVVCAITATVDVIKRTAELGCNLIIVHEPTFYMTPDFSDWRGGFANEIYEEKCRLLDQYGITIWRDHDHMHVHKPDSIFSGVIKYLGWEPYLLQQSSEQAMMYKFALPPRTLAVLQQELMDKLDLNGMRVIGRQDAVIRNVAIVGHLFPESHGGSSMQTDGTYHEYSTAVIRELENGVDAIIPAEVVEWTVLSYLRDAVQLGKVKAMLNVGHFSLEQLGMKFAADWLAEITEQAVPVHYVATGDLFDYSIRYTS